MSNLLIIDDDPQFCATLTKALKKHGHRALGITETNAIPATVAIQRPDAILLDMVFESGTSGLEICSQIRSWSAVPILIISVLDDDSTKINVLRAGADDFLVKPFGFQELLARVRAVQRRLEPRISMQSPVLELQTLKIDLHSEAVYQNGAALELTKNEYTLLKLLVLAEGRIVTYQTLLATKWPDSAGEKRQTITTRTLVRSLREKLGDDPANPTFILSEANLGYRFNIHPGSVR